MQLGLRLATPRFQLRHFLLQLLQMILVAGQFLAQQRQFLFLLGDVHGIRRILAAPDPALRGGVIHHTQGSGKSLTMVWLAKWIRENRSGARVLIITDRTELDEQIEKVFKGVSEHIHRTKSGADLVARLRHEYQTARERLALG